MALRFPLSTRLQQVQPAVVPIVGRLISETPGTISFGQGSVSFGPPQTALARLEQSLDDPDSYVYGDDVGLPELIDALRTKIARENGIRDTVHNRVMVTAGSNMAFVHVVLAIADPGDEIVLLAPYYFNHEMAVAIAGCRTTVVATDEHYQPRLDAIRDALTTRTRAIVTVSPNNPSGAVYGEGSLRAINDLCRDRGLYHVWDAVYEYFTFDGVLPYSPASAPDTSPHTISMFSFSKAYGMAGLRVGYVVYPAHLDEAMFKIQDTVIVHAPIPAQHAACGALETGRAYTEPYRREIVGVSAVVRDALAEICDICTVSAMDGAFYCLLRVHAPLDPMTVTERLIREYRIAVLPGTAFGMTDGCYLRIAYGALDACSAEEGIGRLVKGLRAIVSRASP